MPKKNRDNYMKKDSSVAENLPEIMPDNQSVNHNHNTKKVSLGPNTKK